MDRKSITLLAIILSVIGLADASYLTYTHYTDQQVACPDTGIINCENVLNSPYSMIFGIPFAVLGVVFFVAELIVIIAIRHPDAFVVYNGIGVAFVAYLIYTEYLIGNICVYCTLVHVITVALFALAILGYDKSRARYHG